MKGGEHATVGGEEKEREERKIEDSSLTIIWGKRKGQGQ